MSYYEDYDFEREKLERIILVLIARNFKIIVYEGLKTFKLKSW